MPTDWKAKGKGKGKDDEDGFYDADGRWLGWSLPEAGSGVWAAGGVRRGRRGVLLGPQGPLEPPPGARLGMPVMGMESEFNVWLDGEEINPETYWSDPTAFISRKLMRREKTSSSIPTGGALYFDRGVIEVVTPVIELAPGCPARTVRNLWEAIGFVRNELTKWGRRTGHDVRLKAYSAHYNISFELRPHEQSASRNIKKLALLLSYILPLPAALLGGNRRSTGVGVRPRGDRVEITSDFTPDPGLMIANATFLLGVVRGIMALPSYELDQLDKLGLPVVKGLVPGKHTTRKGWLAKDFHFPQSPFTTNVDAQVWETRDGRVMSQRAIAREIAWKYRASIRRFADPFSFRLVFAILEGRLPSLLELPDRPAAYDDVGRSSRWGQVIPALRTVAAGGRWSVSREEKWATGSFQDHLAARAKERAQYERQMRRQARRVASATVVAPLPGKPAVGAVDTIAASPGLVVSPAMEACAPRGPAPAADGNYRGYDRRDGLPGALAASGSDDAVERRRRPKVLEKRGNGDRRTAMKPVPFPDRRLSRSAYEQVFLKLVSGHRLRISGETHTPVGMKGWYHALFRRDSDGREVLLSIDQLLRTMKDWL
jgi:hypothetical protein